MGKLKEKKTQRKVSIEKEIIKLYRGSFVTAAGD